MLVDNCRKKDYNGYYILFLEGHVMSMQKISMRNGSCYLGVRYLGVPKKFHKGILTITNRTMEIKAIRGSIDENGDFIALCKEVHCERCQKKGKGNCRYNPKLHKEEGYYIDT